MNWGFTSVQEKRGARFILHGDGVPTRRRRIFAERPRQELPLRRLFMIRLDGVVLPVNKHSKHLWKDESSPSNRTTR